MTLHEFSDIFGVLALQLRQADADEATMRSYFEALKDLELEFVGLAAQRFAKSGEWFPKTSEWRVMTRRIEAERIEAHWAVLRTLPAPLCLACDDTGWARNPETNRVTRCDCASLRRLEILGRRPWPQLPSPGKKPDKLDARIKA